MDDIFRPQEDAASSTFSKVIDGIQSTADHISEAVERAKRPGMPLDQLAARVRETPLAALVVAFLLGVIVTRRR